VREQKRAEADGRNQATPVEQTAAYRRSLGIKKGEK
jgi:hypothetical protein